MNILIILRLDRDNIQSPIRIPLRDINSGPTREEDSYIFTHIVHYLQCLQKLSVINQLVEYIKNQSDLVFIYHKDLSEESQCRSKAKIAFSRALPTASIKYLKGGFNDRSIW